MSSGRKRKVPSRNNNSCSTMIASNSIHSWILLLSLLLLLVGLFSNNNLVVHGYPLVATVNKGVKRCFIYNIPDDDDAHMVFLALPTSNEVDDADESLEKWFVEQVYELTKKKTGSKLPNKIRVKPPDELITKMDAFLEKHGDNKAGTMIRVGKKQWEYDNGIDNVDEGNYKQTYKMSYGAKYFAPTVINRVRSAFPNKNKDGEEPQYDDEYATIEEYEVCFDNTGNHDRKVQLIMDFILLSYDASYDEATGDDDVAYDLANAAAKDAKALEKEKHLTPLEEQLTKSIDAANMVMKELKHIGDREARMRKFSDKVNTRVQMFSILSVVVLMGVSYIQISYLHRFFHKRKLL